MILYGSHYGAGSRLSSRQDFSRDPEGFARHCGIPINEQTFHYPINRVILPDTNL